MDKYTHNDKCAVSPKERAAIQKDILAYFRVRSQHTSDVQFDDVSLVWHFEFPMATIKFRTIHPKFKEYVYLEVPVGLRNCATYEDMFAYVMRWIDMWMD